MVALRNDPESKNFRDDTGLSLLTKLFYKSQAQQENYINNQMDDIRAVGGYGKWLHDSLNSLTPSEIQMMHNNNLTLGDIYLLRSLKAPGYRPDPEIPIYRK